MSQQHVSAPAFLIAVASFGIFLAVVFQKTVGHVLATMLAHFSLTLALALEERDSRRLFGGCCRVHFW